MQVDQLKKQLKKEEESFTIILPHGFIRDGIMRRCFRFVLVPLRGPVQLTGEPSVTAEGAKQPPGLRAWKSHSVV